MKLTKNMLFQQFYKTLIEVRKRHIFDVQDLDIVFGAGVISSQQISRWQEKKYLIKLKKGLYIFADAVGEIHPYLIANKGYYPSYISLETALHEYGFIPEVSHAVTSISTKKTYSFFAVGTTFYYKKIKNTAFIGYGPRIYADSEVLMANPEKALIDFLYLNSTKFKREEEIEELRLNYFEMKEKIDKKKLRQYALIFESGVLDDIVVSLIQKF